MRLLLDTHAWLWFVLGDSKISSHALELVEDSGNTIFVSPGSYWEIAIKISKGKYALPRPFDVFLKEATDREDIRILHIEPAHAIICSSLPFHHRDPFDRMLVAQSLVEGIPLISSDPVLDEYGIQRIW